MARYKRTDTSPRFLAVDLQRQLLPTCKGVIQGCTGVAAVDGETLYSEFAGEYS